MAYTDGSVCGLKMFKKIDLYLDDKFKNHIQYLERYIDRGVVLYKDDTLDFKFKDYPNGTDEKKILDQYLGKYTIYKQVDFPYKAISNYLPKSLVQIEKPIVHWQTFNGGSLVPPHVDKGRLCAINIYTKVNGEKTIVYKKKRSGSKLETVNNIITNESFIPDWVEEIDSFVAQPWDCYILDVSSPHAVINMTDAQRISISFSFYKLTYNNVKEFFNV